MPWILALVFLVCGAALADEGFSLALLAAIVGWLLGTVVNLRDELHVLKHSAASRREPPVTRPAEAPEEAKAVPSSSPDRIASTTVEPREQRKQQWQSPGGGGDDSGLRDFNSIIQPALRWLLSGNVPAKVGVVISFFGVSFLLKYAVESGLLSFSPVIRILAALAFGIGLLVLGWRWRESRRSYAMVLMGGGIGILYLAVFAAFRLYHLVPAGVAFPLMALIAAGSVWLAVGNRAFMLAALGITGGFLAPVLASTGTGSHVALFSYYLLINVGIAAVAWFRHWRLLNLIGFTFTFVIGATWGAQYYRPEYIWSVEPFLVAHFLLYVGIAVLSALRQPFRLKGYVDSALVFGLPLVVFALQSLLLDDVERGMSWATVELGLFYVLMSQVLARRYGETLKLLAQSFLALGVAFLTIAVPLWFEAPWISGTWALEGAGMVWIGLRQGRSLTRYAGIVLIIAAFPALQASLHGQSSDMALLNAHFLGMVTIAIPAIFAGWCHERTKVSDSLLWTRLLAWPGLVLWLYAGGQEIDQFVGRYEAAAGIGLLAGTGLVLWALLQKTASTILRQLAFSLVLLAPWLALAGLLSEGHSLENWRWLGWSPVAGFVYLLRREEASVHLRGWIDSAILWSSGIIASDVVHALAEDWLPGQLWDGELAILAACAVAWLVARFLPLSNSALARNQEAYLAILLLVAILNGVAHAGGQQPLPYLPLLNGLFLSTLAALATAAWLTRDQWRHKLVGKLVMAGVSLLVITQEIGRATHQFTDVAYRLEPLLRSDVFQASVSVVWSIIGISAMVFGAQRQSRETWMAGAGLMGVVVVKLFLVDLGNTETVARIVSFIGVGVLLLVVGYFAPAPKSATGPASHVE
ncbi:MAG: DUF2339 domain-containing protein [Gammaproteobacteria bacterium]|nr:DUF2339 domain-containing protein [Gammaproteobacteria bacterium]